MIILETFPICNLTGWGKFALVVFGIVLFNTAIAFTIAFNRKKWRALTFIALFTFINVFQIFCIIHNYNTIQANVMLANDYPISELTQEWSIVEKQDGNIYRLEYIGNKPELVTETNGIVKIIKTFK